MAGSAVWLDVLPAMNKFGAQLSKQAGTAAKAAGLSAGRQLSAGINAGAAKGSAAALVTELETASKKAARVVQAEKVAIQQARSAEKAAAVGVQAAEARLAEQRAKYASGSSQALKAEQQLVTARGQQQAAALKVTAVEDQLRAAFNEQKAVTSQLADAQSIGARAAARQQGAFTRLAAAGAPLSSGLRKIGSGIKSVGTYALATVKPLAGLAAGFGAIIGVSKVISLGNEYTRTLNELQSVADLTNQQMVKVSKTARTLGSDLTLPATSGADAAKVMLELAKGGLSAQEAMQAAKGTIQLAAAAQVQGADAAEIQSNALNQFGLSAGKASYVADTLANTANAASGGITDIAYSLKYVGPAARAVGVNLRATSSAIGLLANQGIKGDQAGTSLRSMLTSLASPSKMARKGLAGLGVEAFDSSGKFLGLRSVIDQLADAQKNMTQEDFLDFVKKAFGKETTSAVVALANSGVQGVKGYDAMFKAVGRAGGAAAVAQSKMKGLGGAMEKLQSQLEDVALGIYQTVTPALTGATNGIAGSLDGAGNKIESFLKVAGGLGKLAFTGKVSAPISGIDPSVVSGIQLTRKIIVDSFRDISSFVTQSLIPSLKNIAIAVGPVVAIVGGAFLLAFRAAAAVLKFIGPALVTITGFFRQNKVATVLLAAAIGGLVIAYKAWIVQQKIAEAGSFVKWASQIKAVAAAQKAWTFATWLAKGAQDALNISMKANVIGLIVIAIAALVAGVIYAYKHFTWFRAAVDAVWSALKVGVKAVGAALGWLWKNAIQPAVDGIVAAAQWMWGNVLQPVFNGIASAVKFVVTVVKAYIGLWINIFKAVGAAAVWVYKTILKPVFDGIAAAVLWLVGVWVDMYNRVVGVLTAIGKGVAWFYKSYIEPIFELIGAIIMKVVVPAFVALWNVFIKPVLNAIGAGLTWLWSSIIQPVIGGIVAVVQWWWKTTVATFNIAIGFIRSTLAAVWNWLYGSVIKPVFDWIVGAIKWWWTTTAATFTIAVAFVRSTFAAVWNWLYNSVIKPVFSWIVNTIRTWWTGTVAIFVAVGAYLRNTFGPVFTWLYQSVIKPIWNGIKTVISNVWKGGIKPVFDTIHTFASKTIPDAFNTFKNAIATAWKAVSDAAKEPIRFVVNTVINDGIIGNFNKVAGFFGTKKMPEVKLPKGFARGGVLPGYQASKRDDVMTPMRRGEGVLVPEVVRALGAGTIHALNAAGNSGGVSGVRKATGYATGGIVGAASSALDWGRSAAETASKVIMNPIGTIGAVVKAAIGQIPGAGGMVDVAAGVGHKLLDAAVSALSKIGDSAGSGKNGDLPKSALAKVSGFAPGPGVGAMGGYLRIPAARAWEAMESASGGRLSLTEGYRDIANQNKRWAMYQAGGNLAARPGTSIHGLGNAADIGAGQAWARANGGRFGWVNTGLGFSQREPWHFEYKGGGGYARGGIIQPTLYDEGGVLPRGLSLVQNNLRQPEVALPVRKLEDIVASQSGSNHYEPHFHDVGPGFTERDYREAMHRMEVMAG